MDGNMQNVVIALSLLLGFVLLIGVSLIPRGRRPRRHEQQYVAKPILTENEKEFYQRILYALPDCSVMCQVAMSALIAPNVEEGSPEYLWLFRSFSQKYVDFVICEPESLEVVAIVELDDITHDPEKDEERDAMFFEAGYDVIRWHSRHKPSIEEIAETINAIRNEQ